MEQTLIKLDKTLETLLTAVDKNIVLFSKAATVEEKRKIAEIIHFLTGSQKNISDVMYNIDNSSFDDFDEDYEDDFDEDDFDDFNDEKKIDFKAKKKKGSVKGKKKVKDDEDLPF
ncbi:MAG: hypothetical protein JW913_07955 [Chitinispirillaceae bacterium]|nr:hypothetical protein [Chitinispirillaceae bacterium]